MAKESLSKEKTRQLIIKTAKQLFLEYGYQKTTISTIAKTAGISVGLINYYFKKEELLGFIFHDFILHIREYLKTHYQKMIKNHLQMHIITCRLFFTKIFDTPEIKELYLLLSAKDLYLESTHEFIRKAMGEIIEEFRLDIAPEFFRKLTVAEYGARQALYIDMQKNHQTHFSSDFIDFTSTITVRLAGISPEIIDQNIAVSRRVIQKIDMNDIQFLYEDV